MVQASGGHVYLVHFRQHWKHLDFARQELESLAEMFGVARDQLFVDDVATLDMKVNPTVYVRLPSDEVCRQILTRSILIKEIIDVFADVKLSRKSRERSRDRDPAAAIDEEGARLRSESEESLVFNYELLVACTDLARLTPHLT